MSGKNDSYSEKLRKALQFIREAEEPVNVSTIGENVDINVMFLSGALTTLAELGALKKHNVGGIHIYDVGDEGQLERISDVFSQ